MKNVLLATVLLMAYSVSAQIKNIGVGISINKPSITSSTENEQLTLPHPYSAYYAYYQPVEGQIKNSFSEKMGLDIKGSFDYTLSSRFFLTSGLTFSYLAYQTHNSLDIPPGVSGFPKAEDLATRWGVPFGGIYENPRFENLTDLLEPEGSEKIGKTRLYSLQVPILAGVSFLKNKISVRAGAVTSFALHATTYKRELYSVEKKTSTKDFNPITAGAMIQADYNITSRISAGISGQHFFTSIYKAGESKLSLLTLGVSYRIR